MHTTILLSVQPYYRKACFGIYIGITWCVFWENSLWILDLWDTSRHHLSGLSCTLHNIHIWTASTVSTTRDNTLKLSHLLATLSTLSSFYREFSLTCHRTDRVIFLATLTKNLWTEPSLLNNSILPTQSDHLLGIEQC